MSTPIMTGAEPISIGDGSHGGVLLLHGYTATPQQMRDWANAFAQAGFAVEGPLLPGHGTVADEMLDTTWSDYVDAAEVCYQKLLERHQQIFVGGICLGGSIAMQLALHHPETTAGIMIINGHFKAPRSGNAFLLRGLLKTGKRFFKWATLPKQVEDPQAPPVQAYNNVPIAPLLSIETARGELCKNLRDIHCPVLIFTSLLDTQTDHNDKWFEKLSGPTEHILLERSNHVATLDYDKGIIETRSATFALTIVKGEYNQKPKEVA